MKPPSPKYAGDFPAIWIERFFSRVTEPTNPDDCWLWNSLKTKSGYGHFAVRQAGRSRKFRVHRMSYRMHYGPFDESLYVCHRCDTPLCVNPDHLFLGTALTNNRDSVSKGRRPRGDWHHAHTKPELVLRGSRHGRARLTDQQVLDIRSTFALGKATTAELAEQFGVNSGTIHFVVKGQTWKHLL